MRYAPGAKLGLQCAKCHPDAADHAKQRGPSRWTRAESMKLCKECHGGVPGAREPAPDVHGNQVGLLEMSRCFKASPNLTCTTCHDPHRAERRVEVLSGKCVQCHEQQKCKQARDGQGCVGCHMAEQKSRKIVFQSYRSHRITARPGGQ